MQLTELIEATVNGLGYELVDFERSARGLLQVFIDHPPTEGNVASKNIGIEDCEKVSAQVHYVLEVENVDYDRLEVSSPGLDRPLKKLADYVRFAGSEAVLTLKRPIEGRKQYRGILRAPHESIISIELKDKEEGVVLDFALSEIDKARLIPQVDFRKER